MLKEIKSVLTKSLGNPHEKSCKTCLNHSLLQ